ncbi:hypothetical protein [Pseudomonas peli]|uniref:hypothetical protein n=1 Tax=Pseudomonas peli TaxID=592361 RepID=UPI0024AD1D1A|nr:hypothetical protein [Pseudomonas peli]
MRQRANRRGWLVGMLARAHRRRSTVAVAVTLAEVAGLFESNLSTVKINALGSQDNQAVASAGRWEAWSVVRQPLANRRQQFDPWPASGHVVLGNAMQVGSLAQCVAAVALNSLSTAGVALPAAVPRQNDINLTTSARLLDGASPPRLQPERSCQRQQTPGKRL